MLRTELPCAEYKIHDCVHEPALHCIRMYSAVCFVHEEYTYACEGTIIVSFVNLDPVQATP